MSRPALERIPSAEELPAIPKPRNRLDRAESLSALAVAAGGCLGATCKGHVVSGYCSMHRYLDASGTSSRSLSVSGPEAAVIAHKAARDVNFGEKAQKMVEASEGATIQRFLEALREISSCTDPYEASERIIEHACKLLNCQRASIFSVDDATAELVLMISKDARTIRLKIGEGIAGHVAQTGQTLLVEDAYSDPRFNAEFDSQTEFKTRNVLCTAIRDYSGDLVGVMQAINKIDGSFSPLDRMLLENLSCHTGIVIHNTFLYEQARSNELKVRTLLDMIQMLHSDAPAHSMLFTLVQKAGQIAGADKATLFLHDADSEQLVVMQSELNTRLPTNKGISGFVARSGQKLNIEDAYDDERFNNEFDIKTGYRTRQILCMPMLGTRGSVIGVLQVINKIDDIPFTPQDEEILTTLLNIAGPVIERSTLYQSVCSKKSATAVDATIELPPMPRQSSREKLTDNVMETISE